MTKDQKVKESFEISENEEFGDLLNYYEKKEKLKVGVYTSGWFEYDRMFPEMMERDLRSDVDIVVGNIKKYLASEAEIIWPGVISTVDDADNAGRLFKKENVDMVVLILFCYVPDFITMQCLRYVEEVPLIIFCRQVNKDIDFNQTYEKLARTSGNIALPQLTGTFKKMGKFKNFEFAIGRDSDKEPYEKIKKYFDAVKARQYLKDINIGIIGHTFRGMFDHDYDRTRITGILGPQVIDIHISHLLDIWNKVTDEEATEFMKEISWIKKFKFQDVGDKEFFSECKFKFCKLICKCERYFFPNIL